MALEARGLGCVRGERMLFEGIDLQLEAGDALWLSGPNGSGKTSLLRLLCGLAQPQHGQVLWQGRPVAEQRDAFHQALCWCGHASGTKDDLSAWENVAFTARLAGRRCSRTQALDALAQLGLDEQAELPTRVLSQGQRKRVALARLCVAPQPQLCVLDEPFTALDAQAIVQLSSWLNTLLAQGSQVVYTTHQPIELRPRQRLHRLALDAAQPC
jgi:heme exporter protein A